LDWRRFGWSRHGVIDGVKLFVVTWKMRSFDTDFVGGWSGEKEIMMMED
ncbi:hypothetical protein A2U01_0097866, partial [Trifolium medium]|nr:hypothetical protein [Trifolium medium]